MAMGKAGKFFGLAVADLIKNACSPQNNGRLVASEWKVFWQTVKSNPKEATELLGELVERMMALLEPKAEKSGVSLETLSNTIAFMTLFTEFKPGDGKIKGRLGAWKVKEKDPDYGRRFPQAKQIMVTLNMRAAKEDLVDRLLISAYTLGTADDFKALIDVAAVPTIDPDTWRMSEGSFSYPYLKRMCDGDRKMRDAVLSATLTKLTSLPSLTTHRRAAEMQVLALFHMLRNFIALGPVYDRAFLAKATATLTTFYFWPMPYGGLAKDLLLMIQKETVAPGAAFRARIQAECKKGFLRGFASEDGQECRPCYMIMNEEDKIAQSFALTMDVVDIENKQAKKAQKTDAHSVALAPATKILMSLAMMRGDLGGELSDADYSQFSALSEADVNTVYRNLEGVLEWIPPQTPADAALEIRKKGFSEIKAKLKTYAKASTDAKKPAAKQPKSAGADPELPPIVHFAISHKLTYKFTSKEEVEIMCLERLPFPEVPLMETFRNLLVEHDPNRTGLKQAELRFAITGSDRVLHNFLCAYFYTKLMAEPSLAPFHFKFFLLPAARNTVAAFLARHDAWYNRHVFLPFRTPNFIVPWLNCDEQGAPNDQEATSLHPPAEFYRRLVEDYLREAENVFHFQVYKLEGWTPADALAARAAGPGAGAKGGAAAAAAAKKKDDKKDEKDKAAGAGADSAYDTLIPFMQRIEFGLSAFAERFRANAQGTKNKIPDAVRTEELCKDKTVLSTYAPADVRLKFVPVDMKGVARDNAGGSGTAAIEDDPNQFTSLQLSAVPALGDKCFPPDPSQPWLELHAQPFKAVKVKGHRSTLFGEPKQHVNSLEIEAVGVGGTVAGAAGGPRFDLLIDGQLFGPFYKVKITPHIDEKTKKQLTFPVQTFFDITNLYQ